MGTPVEQYVPPEFQDVIDLGSQELDQAAIARAASALDIGQKKVIGSRRREQQLQREISKLQERIARQPKRKGKAQSPQINSLKAQLVRLQAQLGQARAATRAGQERASTLQTQYYEVSGQYGKLLQGENRDAFLALQSLFNQYGLGSLAPKIYDFVKQGYGGDTISILLQDTPEYKERFAANETRRKAGLPVLSPAEYLETESAYRQILRQAGLPVGFYDNPADFRNWIAGDVSPTELKGRVDLAVANTMQANPATKQALQQLYGVDEAYLTAYFIDEKRALPLLQKQAQAAAFGGEALRRGLTLNLTDLEDYVTAGLSLSQVSQGFQAVAEALPNIQAIAARYGETFTQRELEQEFIAGTATSGLGETRRKRLASQERALFAGYGGATPGGLSPGFRQT